MGFESGVACERPNFWVTKIKNEKRACTSIMVGFLSCRDNLFSMPPYFLPSIQCPKFDMIRSKERKIERERERERGRGEKKGFFLFSVVCFRFHRIYVKKFVQPSSSLRSRRRDPDPKLRSEIYKVLAYRWSQCSDQISPCG